MHIQIYFSGNTINYLMTSFQEKDCKNFSGYKPCVAGENCSEECKYPNPFGIRILIVNLDAMGDVLMTTAQLHSLKRVFPLSTIYWITRSGAAQLLANNPFIDQIIAWQPESWMILQRQEFDIVLNADKSKEACSFVETLQVKEIRGFRCNRFGQIIPANESASYNYMLGLDDQLKFRINRKTGQEILAESWSLPYERDEYVLHLTKEEEQFCIAKKQEWNISDDQFVVGLNTGCSELYPNKKMTVEQHCILITALRRHRDIRILLLGGKEDTVRNEMILKSCDLPRHEVIATPTTEGIRRGLCYLNIANLIVSGDSFGMHAAIALKKHVVVWFGVSCWEEIDIYDRGKKFIPHGLECSPCWKQQCPYNLECITQVDLQGMEEEILRYKSSFQTQYLNSK